MQKIIARSWRLLCGSYIWVGALMLSFAIALTAVSEVPHAFFFPAPQFWLTITALFLQVWVVLGVLAGTVTIFISPRRALVLFLASAGFAIPLFAMWRVCGGCGG